MNTIKISRFLSLILKHNPKKIGIELDNPGWIAMSVLLKQLNANGKNIDFETLEEVVRTNDKQRFAFNHDKTQIRASQGHSLNVDLEYKSI